MEDENQISGEYPANIEQMPGAIKVDDVAHKQLLGIEAEKYLSKFPNIKKGAQRLGKDLVAVVSPHGKEIIIGIGVASAITAGIVLYRHKRKEK